MKRFSTAILALMLTLHLTASNVAPAYAQQSGKKAELTLELKGKDTKPVAKANVSVSGLQGSGGLADNKAVFTATSLTGKYDIKVTKTGYKPYAATINVTGQETITWTVNLMAGKSPKGTLTLKLKGKDKKPVGKANVSVSGLQGSGGLADNKGVFTATSHTGKYDIKVSKTGYKPYAATINVTGQETITWTILLTPTK